MFDKHLRQMPLAGKEIRYEGLKILPNVEEGMVMIQKSNSVDDQTLAKFNQALEQKLGFNLPDSGTYTQQNDIKLLSCSPISWMLLCNANKVDNIVEICEQAAGDAIIIATDMTDQYMHIDLSGAHIRDILSKGCDFDLSQQNFAKNSAIRTLLADKTLVIWRGKTEDLSLFVDVGIADNIWHWLEDAALEYS